MTNAILRGKPDAGKPHVRFDEGEVASAKPRRGSLLYNVVVRDNLSNNDEAMRNGSPVRLSGTAVMDRCVVRGNTVGLPYDAYLLSAFRQRVDELAGGVYLANGTSICRNTLIVGNKTVSQPGAGAYVVAGTLENCTVVGNSMTASTNAEWSAGIYAWPGAKIINCISDANMNCEVAINAGGEEGVDFSSAYKYSCLPGLTAGGIGCTTADPQLDADYWPRNVEHVLGKGKNSDWMRTALDLAGFPRIQGARVDMGCYETDKGPVGFALILR